ncbi:hypothetical protein PGTUg99_023969 [Puccinia graminis f. sp. tritici]|uniref:Uncharacterized protein n=1 Tax=Puccinia graminis f. sp. tritici TaxID=56615 RepID=A0A5B0SDL2_PUCGR|nr:hypothetical protein PGTUg99_023969 [Puccinia graminis f. sp. tritici]
MNLILFICHTRFVTALPLASPPSSFFIPVRIDEEGTSNPGSTGPRKEAIAPLKMQPHKPAEASNSGLVSHLYNICHLVASLNQFPPIAELFQPQTQGKEFQGLVGSTWRLIGDRVTRFPETSFSSREIDAGKAILIQLQTTLLPALRQHLSGLVSSFDLSALERKHNPNYTDVLELTHQLDRVLKLIDNSVICLSPDIELNEANILSKVDHGYGILKRYRCKDFVAKVETFLATKLRDLLAIYWTFITNWSFSPLPSSQPDVGGVLSTGKEIIALTDQSCHMIDDIIKWFKLSDFGILQETWQQQADLLSDALIKLTRQIDHTVNPREQTDPTQEDEPRNNPGENFWGGFNGFNPEEDQPENDMEVVGSSQEISLLNLDLIPRIRSIIPLLKVGRIFLNRLLDNGKVKLPFDLRTRVSSQEWESLKQATSNIHLYILKIVEAMSHADDEENLRDRIGGILDSNEELFRAIHTSLALLACFLVPVPSRLDPYLSENLFKAWFFEVRSSFSLAQRRVIESLGGHETLHEFLF